MKLFQRNSTAWGKWRERARWIDLHKTKITIGDAPPAATHVQEPVPESQSWLRQLLLEGLNTETDSSMDSQILKSYMPDLHTQNRCSPLRIVNQWSHPNGPLR